MAACARYPMHQNPIPFLALYRKCPTYPCVPMHGNRASFVHTAKNIASDPLVCWRLPRS